ncbi:MAG TPA: hypothetical protein VNS63_12300, partial [Blastocatellia bacterium]|nr:hypothetical protein [Blastocatellia bacterium]
MKEKWFSNSTSNDVGRRGSSSRIRRVGLIVVAGAVLSWCAAASARSQSPFDYFPTNGWRASSPDEQGLDRKRLKKLVKKIRRND